jgi:hypothetical protein
MFTVVELILTHHQMKSPYKLFMLVAALLIFTGCTKDDTPQSVSKKISSGTWQVTYFWDKDKDETYKFQSYSFSFNSNNVLEVTTPSGTETGAWVFDTSDDSHDHFIITLPDKDPLDELNDDWHVISITNKVIELKDESGSGGIEYLTFKIK